MADKSKQTLGNMFPSYSASSPEADNNTWARSFNYHNTLEERSTTSAGNIKNNSVIGSHESSASGSIPARLGGSAASHSRNQSTANLMVHSNSSLVDTPPATPFLPPPPTPHSSTPIRKRLSFPLTPITDLFISSSHRRRPSLTPSQTAQISSPAPPSGSRPGTTGGPGARSRSRSTSATQATEATASAGPFGSSPPGTMKFAAMPIATAGPSMRVGGGMPGELMMRSIGEGTISMDEDSPTDSHYRGMPYGRAVREVPEDISEDGEWEGDFDSKRSRASTLSSPASVTGVLGGSLAGLRRKISDSKRIMKPLSPDSTHAADLRIIKNQQRAITPSSGFRSPPSGHTSDDDDMDDDSIISGFGRGVVQGGMPYSHSRPPTRRQPPPLEVQTSAPATLTVRSGKIMSMNPSSSSSSLHMQATRSHSVPPKQLLEIGPSPMSLNTGKPSTSGGPVPRNLEIPSDMCGSTALQAARLSSVNQAPSSGQLTQQNRSISTTAMSSIARSDSNSSSGTNNTNSMISMTTNNSNVGQPSSAAATQQPQIVQQGQLQNKYLTAQDRKNSSKVSLAASARLQKGQVPDTKNPNSVPMPRSSQPPFPDPATAPKVAPAPASGMYWYKAPEHGQQRLALRAHTCTMVGSSIYVFGGCDRVCYNDMHVFDTDSMSWSKPTVYGDIPPPLRAMTTTAVGKKLVIFGGGDGPTYFNDVYIFDTTTNRYTKPVISGEEPSKRRAHTACFYRNGIYIFGGGDGERALDDVWRLDVSDFNKLFWKCVCPPSSGSGSASSRVPANTSTTSLSAKIRKNGPTSSNSPHLDGSLPQQQRPTARGYHTANMVGSKLIVYGGSDGQECFRDVWVFDVDTEVWKQVPMDPPPPPPPAGATTPLGAVGGGKVSFKRLSHTATIVGSYLFVVGGHDGVEYSSEVLLLNLVTMQWDKRKVYGQPPTGRGYHGAVLHDSRVFVIGGFDGQSVFADTYVLELAVSSYFSQISHFSIEV